MEFNLDFLSILGLVVGIAALGTTIYVAHNQNRLTNKIRKVSDEQQGLLEDTRNFYATAFVKTVQKIAERFSHVIDIHNDQNNKTQKSTILKGYYDGHLINMLPKIEDIELVKIFGLEIAEKYRIHTTNKSSKTWGDSESEINSMMDSYKQEMFNLVQLKDILLPFCDETVNLVEDQLEENYQLIVDTYQRV